MEGDEMEEIEDGHIGPAAGPGLGIMLGQMFTPS
jgi:hypothetical protein